MPYSNPHFGPLLLSLAAAALAIGEPAAAQSEIDRNPAGTGKAADAPRPPGPAPFLGEWELDLTRMPDGYGAPPKRVTYAFEDIGSGKWLTRIEITAPDDSVRHMAVRYRRDGTVVAGEGDTAEADSAAVNSPALNVLVMSLSKNKVLGSVRVYVISEDGAEMTEAAANVNDAGAPFVRNFHFRRIR